MLLLFPLLRRRELARCITKFLRRWSRAIVPLGRNIAEHGNKCAPIHQLPRQHVMENFYRGFLMIMCWSVGHVGTLNPYVPV
jgi:hypothetical protein